MVVVQHTAIALSWSQVKVLTYFLKGYLDAHEVQNGRIKISPGIVSPVSEEIPKDAANPIEYKKAVDAMVRHYNEFVRENPEIVGLIAGSTKRSKSKSE